MERRVESRFQVTSKIRVIVPSPPARILDCDLMDISATGMRILSPGRVEPEDIVAVEVDLRLILAEVRHCQTRGAKFVIGVRRLHEVDKNALLSDPITCVQEMIADLHKHISAHGEPDGAGLTTRALENIVERDGKVDAAPPEDTAALTNEPVSEEFSEELPVEAQAESAEAEEAVVETPAEVEVLDATWVEEPAAEAPDRNDVVEADEWDEEVESPVEAAPVEASAEAAPAEEPLRETPGKVELLEPKRPAKMDLLDAIRSAEAQKAADLVVAPKGGRWQIPTAIAAGLLLTVGIAFTLNERRAEAARHASSVVVIEAPPPTPTAAPEPQLAAPTAPEPQPAAPPAAEAVAPAAEGHHAQMKMTRAAWVSITTDGGQPFKARLKIGDVRDIDFRNDALLWLGDGSGVQLKLDGTPVARLKRGAVLLQLTPDGVKFPNTAAKN